MPKKKLTEQEIKPIEGQPVTTVPATPVVTRRSENPPIMPQLYANGFQVVLGPLDIRMFVIETSPVSPTEVVDKRLLSIIMTPETLRLLAQNLPQYVEMYEKEFGKLRDIQTSDKERVVAPSTQDVR